jgi:MFS family permease
MWMARAGRRRGFVTGACLGAAGGVLAATGIVMRSLPLLSLGTFLVGTYQAFAQFYRFAAAEVSDDAFRSRAISFVLAGGVAAAFLGPALGRLGGPLLATPYVGSFLILTAISVSAAGMLLGLRVPTPRAETSRDTPRPLLEIMQQPTYAVAVFAAATGGGVMVLAMTAMPLAMAHHHHGLAATSMVMQLHVLGMFLPSFFTGSLVARWGIRRVMLAGVALQAAHVAMSLTGSGFVSFASALLLLGVGWNFLYVGGTTLLTQSYRPVEKGRAQATNDLLVFTTGLAASLGAGILLAAVGWRLMNIVLLPWLLVAAAAVWWVGSTRRAQPLRQVGDLR